MNDKKNIREQSIEELLPYILAFGDNTLTKLEQTFLHEMFINNTPFNELTKHSKLTIFRQRQIFNNAVKRLSRILGEANTKLNAYTEMENELAITKKKLEEFQSAADKQNTLAPELKELLATPIEKIGFSARVMNICLGAEIETIADLVRYRKQEFFGLRNMGKKSGEEVDVFLKNKGLSWKMQL